MRLFLILIVLVSLLAASAPADAARAERSAQASWQPGSYSGWVYLLARLTKNHKISQQGASLTQDTVVFWQSHGDLEVTASADGQGSLNAHLPLEITAMEVGNFTTDAGSCSFNMAARGETYLNTLGLLTPIALTDRISIGTLLPDVSASVTNNSAQGQCGNIGQTALFIQDTLKNTTQKMSELTFHVGYQTPLSVGGTCELKDWKQSMPLPNGSLSREMLECSWRVFREPQEKEAPTR